MERRSRTFPALSRKDERERSTEAAKLRVGPMSSRERPHSSITAGDLRVALCFGTYPPERNGGADFLARFARALAEAGVAVTVLTSPADAPEFEEFPPRLAVHRIVDDWALLGRAGRHSLAKVNRVLRAADVQVLHVFFPDSVLQGRYQLPAAVALRRVRVVTTFWNLGLGSASPLLIRAESLALLARTRVLTSHDPGYLRLLRRPLGLGRPVRWLPVGNNLEVEPVDERSGLRERLTLDPEAAYLAYFGQLDSTRGVADLFEALRRLRTTKDVRLLMIGSAGREERYAANDASYAYYRRMLELPATLGIADAVTWTPYLADAEVARMLQAVDLCVLPYRRNSVGRSALAAALSLGVATVLAGTEPDIVPLRADDDVALVPPARADLLADTVGGLLRDPATIERLRHGALRAARFFEWPRIAAIAIDVYREALAKR
jgi:glycosyltransferase involved in cell wall biosynthesis